MLDRLWWWTATVWMEAQGEPEQGQLAVAHVIGTRTRAQDPSGENVLRTVLQPLQFSCWNGNSPVRGRLATCEQDSAWLPSLRAACAAAFQLLPDPTDGATHYCRSDLNPKPSWFESTRVTARIGAHTFLRLP